MEGSIRTSIFKDIAGPLKIIGKGKLAIEYYLLRVEKCFDFERAELKTVHW